MRSSRSSLPSLRAPSTRWLWLLCLLHHHLVLIVFLFFFFFFFVFLSFSSSLRVSRMIRRGRPLPSVSPLLSTLLSRISPASTPSNTSVHWRQTSAPAQKIRDKLIDTRRTWALYIPTILVECKTSLKAGAKKRRSSLLCVRVCSSPKGPYSRVLVTHLTPNVDV